MVSRLSFLLVLFTLASLALATTAMTSELKSALLKPAATAEKLAMLSDLVPASLDLQHRASPEVPLADDARETILTAFRENLIGTPVYDDSKCDASAAKPGVPLAYFGRFFRRPVIVGPNTMITRIFDLERLQVQVDASSTITRFVNN